MVLPAIPNPLESLGAQLEAAAGPLQAAVEQGATQLAAQGGDACNLLGTLGSVAGDVVAEAARLAENAIALTLGAVAAVGAVVGKVIAEVTNLITGAIDKLASLAVDAIASLTSAVSGAIDSMTSAISDATAGLQSAISDATAAISGALDQVAAVIGQAVDALGAASCTAITNVVSGIGGGVVGALDTINDAAEAGIGSMVAVLESGGSLEALAGNLEEGLAPTIENLGAAAAGAAGAAAEAASGAMGSVGATMETALTGAVDQLKALLA